MRTDLVKVLTGFRRSGKSAMLELIREELLAQGVNPLNCITLNFEDLENTRLCTAPALYRYIQEKIRALRGKVFLFLDEIQEVSGWEKCVNSLRISPDTDIYITGSNATLLSGELATYLAGRYVEIEISPFSFKEFVEIYRTYYPDVQEADIFRAYLTLGGMPFLHHLNFREEPCKLYLRDIYNSVILKDILGRNNIRNPDLLERLIFYSAANIGHTFSATSIANYFKHERRTVSPETVLNYLKACEDAFLFHRLKRQDLPGKKVLTVQEKFYLADHGLREAVYGKNQQDIGQVLENIVYMELSRRGYQVTVGKMYDTEIDFVCEKMGNLLYVQVAYLLGSPETIAREFGSLEKIRDNYPKYVFSMDELNMSRGGIRHCHIRDFLLAPEDQF
jgi:predicted AAA+ superfamily ATPase